MHKYEQNILLMPIFFFFFGHKAILSLNTNKKNSKSKII